MFDKLTWGWGLCFTTQKQDNNLLAESFSVAALLCFSHKPNDEDLMIFKMYKVFYSCLETLLLHPTASTAFSKSDRECTDGSRIFYEKKTDDKNT